MPETLTRDDIMAKVRDGESLAYHNLRGADLRGANLYGANLYGANLYGANLYGANLCGANLCGANLGRANLGGANLGGATLYGANLCGADLRGADLGGANLYGANLCGADLCGANLCGANLGGATLATGETWEQYLAEVVPALCVAGGVSLHEVVAHFACHDWANCPMAAAFRTSDLRGIPILMRPRAEQFIQFFDACLIEPVVADDGTIAFRSPVTETPDEIVEAAREGFS